jgi:hypothetical protein
MYKIKMVHSVINLVQQIKKDLIFHQLNLAKFKIIKKTNSNNLFKYNNIKTQIILK